MSPRRGRRLFADSPPPPRRPRLATVREEGRCCFHEDCGRPEEQPGPSTTPPVWTISSDEESLPETVRTSPAAAHSFSEDSLPSWETVRNLYLTTRTPSPAAALSFDEDSTSLPSPTAAETRPPDAPPSYEEDQRLHYAMTYPKEMVFEDAWGKRIVYRRVDDE